MPVEQIPTSARARPRSATAKSCLDSACRARPPHSGDAYLRFTPRTEMDIAVVGAGVNLTLDANGVCTAARVAPRRRRPDRLCWCPRPARRADRHHGRRSGARRAWRTPRSAACRPIDDKRGTKEFRIKVAGVLARRAAAIALERAGGRTDVHRSIM